MQQIRTFPLISIFLIALLTASCGGGGDSGGDDGDNNIQSTDASLSNLTVSSTALSPAFQANQTAYTSAVAYDLTSVTITPVANDANATIEVNGAAVTSGGDSAPVALAIGSNNISVEVTAEDGTTTQNYTVAITRAAPSSDAELSDLSLSDINLNQLFQSNQTSYTASAGFNLTSLTITPEANEANATIEVNGVAVTSGSDSAPIPLSIGSNSISVEVTAEDGTTTQTYTIAVTRSAPSSDANLSGLSLSDINLDQVFQSNQTAYTASGRFSQSSVMVTPVASDTNAAIQVNGLDVTSGAASGAISLSTGSNTLTIAVTAEDGSTTQSYTVDVTRLPPASDADLAGLALSDITLDQVFQSNQTTYTASTGFLQNSLTVTPQTSDQYASIEVNGSSVESGDASDFIALAEGSNTLTVIVTAEDGTTTQTYTVDVTRANAASFAQQAYVKASNTEQQDSFGRNVALSGDTLAVAAPGERSNATGINGDESNNDQNLSGAVYVFTRSGGIWTQQAYIKSSTSLFNNQFGSSLALDQDTLVITAPGENAVYIFTRNGSDWTQQQILSDVTAGRLALEADTLVIGNPGDASNATGINGDENNSDETKSGAVYVYTRTANTWTRQAYIKASNTDQYDRFGWSVALSGDTLAVGATGEDSTATGINGDQSINATGGSREHTHRGAAYVFTRSNGSWTQQAYIKPTNTGQEYKFGFSVALSGDTLAVSQPYEDIDLLEEGAVYIYTRSGTDWSQQAYLQDNSYVILFGWSLDLSGDSLVVGANLGGTSTPEYVYYYNRNGNIWSQQDKLEASNSGEYDQFGGSLSLSGDTVAIGAQREDSNATGINGNETNNDAILSGAVYVFQ